MQNDESKGQQSPSPDMQFSSVVAPYSNSIKPKKSRKTLYKVLISVGVILFVALGVVLAFYLTTGSNIKIREVTSLSETGDLLKDSINDSDKFTANIQETSVPTSVIKRINEKVWAAVDDKSSVLTVNSLRDKNTLNETDYNRVIKAMKSGGLKEVNTTSSLASDYSSSAVSAKFFESDFIVCNLRNAPILDIKITNSNNLEVNCANKSDFSKNTQEIMKFADAYLAKKTSDKDLVFSSPNAQKSSVDKYQNALLNVAELDFAQISKGMFYQEPGKNWSFLTITTNINGLSCSEYSTEASMNAFVGYNCVDDTSKKSSFVKRPVPVLKEEVSTGPASGG